MNDTLSCTLLSPMSSNNADFKQTFRHSKHGNYQPITWESVLLLSCARSLPGTKLKFSQMGVLNKKLAHRTFYQTWKKKICQIFLNGKKKYCVLSVIWGKFSLMRGKPLFVTWYGQDQTHQMNLNLFTCGQNCTSHSPPVIVYYCVLN